jgi:hypothetical protein
MPGRLLRPPPRRRPADEEDEDDEVAAGWDSARPPPGIAPDRTGPRLVTPRARRRRDVRGGGERSYNCFRLVLVAASGSTTDGIGNGGRRERD